MTRFRFIIHILFSLPRTIIFNFYYLPLKQAVKLPIFLYKPTILCLKGTVSIDCHDIRTGMIKLGFPTVSIYPDSGIVWENAGNVIFKGSCRIGNNSALAIGKSAKLIVGNSFSATTTLRLVCYNSIEFGSDVLIGWENTFCDTDFHSLKQISDNNKIEASSPIFINNNNWFAMKCVILKGAKTPNSCIVASNSLLNKDYSQIKSNCLLAGTPAKIVKSGIYRDCADDNVNYK